jgi:hypothetical protein
MQAYGICPVTETAMMGRAEAECILMRLMKAEE